MQKINLQSEMSILKNNFTYHYDLNKNLDKKIENRNFHPSNWIVTFPYNFPHETCIESNLLNLIRKLALINSLYGFYFLCEDDVIDDYNHSVETYRSSLLSLCDAHIFRNLAIGYLLKICGSEIYNYIHAYEEGYYQAIIFEKTLQNLTAGNFFNKDNLQFLGQKLIPICTTFAAYCILHDDLNKIPVCEEMIIKYHIARQMLDDIEDLREDIKKPDLSYLLKLFPREIFKNNFPAGELKKFIKLNKIDLEIINCMIYYLNEAEEAAKYLNFDYFLAEIRSVREKALLYKKRSVKGFKDERTAV